VTQTNSREVILLSLSISLGVVTNLPISISLVHWLGRLADHLTHDSDELERMQKTSDFGHQQPPSPKSQDSMKSFVLTAVLLVAACDVSSLVRSKIDLRQWRNVHAGWHSPVRSIIFCYTETLISFPERPLSGVGDCTPVHRLQSEDLLVLHSDLFDITDANKDDIITIEEWLDSTVRSTSGGETCSMLVKQWSKFDPVNVGYHLLKTTSLNYLHSTHLNDLFQFEIRVIDFF
jgi:hypothetical protein